MELGAQLGDTCQSSGSPTVEALRKRARKLFSWVFIKSSLHDMID